ncbi:MAG: hypothetical protein J5858_00705, partial [Lentisphaeria bacterium]|nr:hypothetical protein [Lentisphaeria bacterium]
AAASEDGVTIALNTELTPELIAEGYAREFVSKVQNLRKETGLEVTDRIEVEYAAGPEVAAALESFRDYITNETLSSTFEAAADAEHEFDLNGKNCKVTVRKA